MEENKIWEEYKKTKNNLIREQIINKYAYLVKIVAGKLSIYTNSLIDYEDLVGYGIFGLIDAIDKFDYQKGFKFETYASLRIRGEIIDNIRKLDWIPRSLRQKNKLLENTIKNFEYENGKEPTEEELATVLNIPVSEVKNLIKNSSLYNLISLDDYLEQGYEKNNDRLVSNLDNLPEKVIDRNETKEILANILDELTEKQRLVISLYYYEELTLKEISKIMQVSESRVSQIHSNTIKKLKKKLAEKNIFTDSINF